MTTPLRVLHVEDSESDSALVLRELRKGGFDPIYERVETRPAFLDALRKEWDVIISDFSLPQYNGLVALVDARETGKDIPFILVSGTIGEVGAVNAMRAGAQDYVLKDSLSRLPLAIAREVKEAEMRAAQRAMTERLAISERMASAGMLAAGVAHEINNPLAVIIANLDVFAAAAHSKELDGPVRDAREAADCIRLIVRDVKLFARAENDEPVAVDVHEVIESSIRMASNEIRHRATIVKDYGRVPFVDSNAARLGQVVLNLLVNAAQAMTEGRATENAIRITTTREADRVIIEIRDTGSGIPKEIIGRIFDPFFTTKPAGIGTGLGLALCHRMVTDLSGHITVESEAGRGTTFRVSLPIATNVAPPMESQIAKAVADATRRARVLVVDDEAAIGRVLFAALSPHHDVTTVTTGRAALKLIESGERYDVILSDLMMPDVTGMEIHEQLSRTALDQAKRMIFLTGGAFTARACEFLDGVPNIRIEKPFVLSNVLDVIARVPALDTVAKAS